MDGCTRGARLVPESVLGKTTASGRQLEGRVASEADFRMDDYLSPTRVAATNLEGDRADRRQELSAEGGHDSGM
jgi:hypothetical protein